MNDQRLVRQSMMIGTSWGQRIARCDLFRNACLVGLLSAVGACGSRTAGGGTDTSTDWLAACERDEDCGRGFACECGVCTTGCSLDSQCAALGSGAVCESAPMTCGGASVCAREDTFAAVTPAEEEADARSSAPSPAVSSAEHLSSEVVEPPLPESGIWETESFEDPLYLRLSLTASTAAGRVCSAQMPVPTLPEWQTYAEFFLTYGTNCENAPQILFAEQGYQIDFVIPWLGLGGPLSYTMFIQYDETQDVLQGSLRPLTGSMGLDITWTRPRTSAMNTE